MPTQTTENKALYAVAGAADLAIEKLRELSTHGPAIAERAEAVAGVVRDKLAELPGEIVKLRAELPADLQKLRDDVPAEVQKLRSDLPGQLKKVRNDLPADVQKLRDELPTVLHDVQTKLVKASGELADVVADLSARGEGAVSRFRRDHADTLDAVTSTVA
ncbi:MAG: hypothetical protein GEV00_22235, partial [Actinophytocola sp.]|nr:hypothetical protein [Actinophytocola sp.]